MEPSLTLTSPVCSVMPQQEGPAEPAALHAELIWQVIVSHDTTELVDRVWIQSLVKLL